MRGARRNLGRRIVSSWQLYALLVLPLPIILALSLSEVRSLKWRKALQTITYAPYFISVVIILDIMLAGRMMDISVEIREPAQPDRAPEVTVDPGSLPRRPVMR